MRVLAALALTFFAGPVVGQDTGLSFYGSESMHTAAPWGMPK